MISVAKKKTHALCQMGLDKDFLWRVGKSTISCRSSQQSCEFPADDWQEKQNYFCRVLKICIYYNDTLF